MVVLNLQASRVPDGSDLDNGNRTWALNNYFIPPNTCYPLFIILYISFYFFYFFYVTLYIMLTNIFRVIINDLFKKVFKEKNQLIFLQLLDRRASCRERV